MYDKYIVGSFDVNKYSDKYKTTTNEVILTPERLKHIKIRHPEVIPYISEINNILNNLDYFFEEVGREYTLWIVKNCGKNVKVTLTKTGRSLPLLKVVGVCHIHINLLIN